LGGHVRPARANRRPEPALAADELKAVAHPPHEQRLQHVVFFEAFRERNDFRLAEFPPRLKRVLVDLVDGQQQNAVVIA
jgi:hypothetical protein